MAALGRRIDPATARVEVDGVLVPGRARPRLLPLEQARRRHHDGRRPPGPAHGDDAGAARARGSSRSGRLDRHTEGLLILTNDGALAQLLTHPSHGVAKEYVAEVDGGTPAPGALRSLRQGVELDDGLTAPAEVGVLAPGVLRLVIHEGRNRQVRRMCERRRPSGAAAGAHPHRAGARHRTWRPGSGAP